MNLTWLGHSCFLLESSGYRILMDPYQNVPGLPDVHAAAEAVYCSHQHFDHAYLDGVRLTKEDIPNPFQVRTIPTFHDDQEGALRGTNTIHCFTAEGLTVVHLGDLGHPLSEEQVQAIGHCDVLLLPVGGTFTIDSAQAKAEAEKLHPTVIVPMHYRIHSRKKDIGFPELTTAEDFTKQMTPVISYPINTLPLPARPQVAVLSLPRF